MSEKEKLSGNWLALDTSTNAMTIALLRDGTVIGESDSESERNHSIRLLPAVEELLQSAGMKAKGLDGVVVGHGPGSYTGIRISVTVGKTFAWSLGIPIIPISSLEALAYGVVMRRNSGRDVAERSWIVPFMDARRGQVYTGLYEWSSDGWKCLVPDRIHPMEQWLSELAERAGQDAAPRFYFAGDVGGFGPLLEGFGAGAAGGMHVDETSLKASAVGALAGMYGMERAVTDIHGFEPNYTQLSEPEKKLFAKNR